MNYLGSQKKSHSFDLGNVVKIPQQTVPIPTLDLPKPQKSSFMLNIRVVPDQYFDKFSSRNSSIMQTAKPNSVGFLSTKKTPETKSKEDSREMTPLKIKLEEVESNPSTQDGNEQNLSLLASPITSLKPLSPEDYSTPTKDTQQSLVIHKLLSISSSSSSSSSIQDQEAKPTEITGVKRRMMEEDSHAIQKKVKVEEGETIPTIPQKQESKTEAKRSGFSLTKTGLEKCKKSGMPTLERKKKLSDVFYDNRSQQWLFVLEIPGFIGTQKKILSEKELLAEDPELYLTFYAGYVQRFGL